MGGIFAQSSMDVNAANIRKLLKQHHSCHFCHYAPTPSNPSPLVHCLNLFTARLLSTPCARALHIFHEQIVSYLPPLLVVSYTPITDQFKTFRHVRYVPLDTLLRCIVVVKIWLRDRVSWKRNFFRIKVFNWPTELPSPAVCGTNVKCHQGAVGQLNSWIRKKLLFFWDRGVQ